MGSPFNFDNGSFKNQFKIDAPASFKKPTYNIADQGYTNPSTYRVAAPKSYASERFTGARGYGKFNRDQYKRPTMKMGHQAYKRPSFSTDKYRNYSRPGAAGKAMAKSSP